MSRRPVREVIHMAREPQTTWWQASTVRIRRTSPGYPVAGLIANAVANGRANAGPNAAAQAMTASASRVTCSAR